MTLINLYDFLNNLYPFEKQEEWDNSGFFNKFENFNVKKAIVALDVNEYVILNAINKNINLVITHHPIYIDINDTKLPHIKKLIKLITDNNITVMSLHTNYDLAKRGMNYQLAKTIGLKNIKQSEHSPYLFFGDIKPIDLIPYLEKVKNKLKLLETVFDVNCYHLVNDKQIKRVAIVGGSGASDLYQIKNKDKIDLFLTSEVKWHLYEVAYQKKISIVDIGHIAEKNFINDIKDKLTALDIEVVEVYPNHLLKSF